MSSIPQSALEQNKTRWRSQLESDTAALLDNFSQMLRATAVSDSTIRTAHEEFQVEVYASKVVNAGVSLQNLVSQLKQHAILCDLQQMNAGVEQRTAALQRLGEAHKEALNKIQEEAEELLAALEEEYAASMYKRGTQVGKSSVLDASVEAKEQAAADSDLTRMDLDAVTAAWQ